MNIEEVEEALRAVNGHLLTDREMQFIYNVCVFTRILAYHLHVHTSLLMSYSITFNIFYFILLCCGCLFYTEG